jgi:hypothetical protein
MQALQMMLSSLTWLGMTSGEHIHDITIPRLTESRLLKSSSHADLTIRSGSYEIKAHKNIVSQCGFFAGACRKDGAFLVRRCLPCLVLPCSSHLPASTSHVLYSPTYSKVPSLIDTRKHKLASYPCPPTSLALLQL